MSWSKFLFACRASVLCGIIVRVEHYCPVCVLEGLDPPPDPVGDELRARRAVLSGYARSGRREPEPVVAVVITAAQRRAEREAAAPGFASAVQVAARREFFGGLCWMCGGRATLMDHVKPLARGGSMWASNLRPACWPCNARKGARWPFP